MKTKFQSSLNSMTEKKKLPNPPNTSSQNTIKLKWVKILGSQISMVK